MDVDCTVNCFLVAVFCSSFNEVMAATLRLLYSVSRPGKISEVQFSVILNIGEIIGVLRHVCICQHIYH